MAGKLFEPGQLVYHPESGEEFILIERMNEELWRCRKVESFLNAALFEEDLIPF